MIASGAINGIGGVDHRIVDRGVDQVDSGLEINQMDPGMSLSVKANQDFPLDIGFTAFSLPSNDLNPPSAVEAFGYSLRQDPLPNTQIDFSEVLRQKGARFESLKETMTMLIEECERQMQSDRETQKHEDEISIKTGKTHRSSVSSKASSSSRKERLRTALLAEKKLQLAKRRAEEEAELAKQNAKTELRRLEDEATLAELYWKIERDYDEGTGLLGANNEVPPKYWTDKLPFQHSRKPALEESEPSRLDISKRPCKTMPDVAPVDYSTPFDKVPVHVSPMRENKEDRLPVTNFRLSCHEDINSFECKPKSVPVTKQEENILKGSRQEIEPPTGNKHQSSVSSNGIGTERAQVLLNGLPVTVTTENGASLSNYAFLDNGCTDTLIDSELADQLNLEGPLEQIGIKTIRNNEELIESKCVSFTLSPVEGCGRDIDVSEAYVLPDLSQSEQVLPEKVDFEDYSHLQVGLLGRKDEPRLPNDYTLAKGRLELLRRRFTKPENRTARSWMSISKGYARELSPEQAAIETSYTWYLPHQPVINLNKPGKLRILFDAAAEFQGTSQNKKPIQDPDMTNSLIGVLLRFRQGKVGLAADVEAMFHQVRVRRQDQDALRFLWWTDDYRQPPDVYVMEVHIFVATFSPCVANSVLRRTAADNAERFEKGVTAIVEKIFYFDDALPSFKDENLAARAASSLAEMLGSGGFRLTKFMSNSKDTLSKIPAERRAKPELNLDLDELPVERALGMEILDNTAAVLVRIAHPAFLLSPRFDALRCKLQLHISDASEVGYGATAYSTIQDPDGPVHCSFVMGKANNSPIKFTSIPSLELQAAVLATRLNKMLREELDLCIRETKYWTDSEIVLHYLRNEKRRFQTYVANRVEEIRENSKPDDWNHVPGTLNPADDVSRGLNPSQLSSNHRWLRGPEFLWQPESVWPNAEHKEVSDEVLELKKVTHANLTDISTDLRTKQPQPLSENSSTVISQCIIHWILSGCSDWNRLRRQVAWLIRFIHFLYSRETVQKGHLALEDYNAAAVVIARLVQRSAYTQEVKDLKARGEAKLSSNIVSLNPVLDDHGILRVKGRVTSPPVADAARNQVILPRNHPVTAIIVRHIRESIGHLGREHLIAKVREKYWIPQIRVLARSILARCILCKRLKAKPMTQQMAPLPKSRMMAYQPPFSYSGMDLFGPLYVKHGRGTAKRWCCLFTCLNTRAVHLELVQSMSTSDFLLCLRRFINRRGEVIELRCDRGSNFVGAERELREAFKSWNQQQIHRELLQRVERVLNGRALTANSDDPNDLQPLTPAHFLMRRKSICLPPGAFEKADNYGRKWKQVQFLADLFWKRWLREYLPTLQIRGKWRKSLPNLKPNALALLVDENAQRGHGSLGRVLEKVKLKDSEAVPTEK
ncbi:hypothetical protein AWC38_SpisGene23847 [Stylophora pistillata]|uniref:Integrase zinc-binding domain-containing protein n=1 Tax=Stylophora pistillata TaxID=50429 RepID=A0A2B4R5Z6_STYPI|nr:hypothetical protein AWC38_SpisGene23847 [Stylophora pistillata]